MAATFNISAAYHITPISPEEQHLLCVSWEGKIYLDYAVSFGMSSSAGIFKWVADMLVALYVAASFKVMIKWVSDFFVIRLPGETWSEEDFIEFTVRLGVLWSWDKLRGHSEVHWVHVGPVSSGCCVSGREIGRDMIGPRSMCSSSPPHFLNVP